VFDVGRDVLVVGVGRSQSGVVGVGLGIVPVQFDRATPNLITITADLPGAIGERELLAHNDTVYTYIQIAGEEGCLCATANNRQCRSLDT